MFLSLVSDDGAFIKRFILLVVLEKNAYFMFECVYFCSL